MYFAEIVILVVVFGFIANGWRSGALETLGRLAGAVLGFLIAKTAAPWTAHVFGLFVPMSWAYLSAFIVTFLLTHTLVTFIFKLGNGILKVITNLPIFKQINEVVGGFFGFCEVIIVIGGLHWLLQQKAFGIQGVQFSSNLATLKLIDRAFQYVLYLFQ
jgi:uncharacterized membrane protein required for colicin V production